jgi:hypothetical protein
VRSFFEPWSGRRPQDSPDLGFHHLRIAMEKAGGHVWAESDGAGQGLLLGLSFPLLARGVANPE